MIVVGAGAGAGGGVGAGVVGAEGAAATVDGAAGDMAGDPPEQLHVMSATRTMRIRKITVTTIDPVARPESTSLSYPCLSVAIGSTAAARLAGTRQAASATPHRTAGTATNVSGSSVVMP